MFSTIPVDVVRIFALPIFFVIINAVVDVLVAVATYGVAKTGESIKLVYTDRDNIVQHKKLDYGGLYKIKGNRDIVNIVDICKLGTLNPLDYPSIPTNLCFAALSADAVAFFHPDIDKVAITFGSIFPVHLLLMFAILFGNILIEREISDNNIRRSWRSILLFLGFICSITAFYTLRQVL